MSFDCVIRSHSEPFAARTISKEVQETEPPLLKSLFILVDSAPPPTSSNVCLALQDVLLASKVF